MIAFAKRPSQFYVYAFYGKTEIDIIASNF